eukprot:3398696-Prymnesium_polylepis.1
MASLREVAKEKRDEAGAGQARKRARRPALHVSLCSSDDEEKKASRVSGMLRDAANGAGSSGDAGSASGGSRSSHVQNNGRSGEE